MSRAETFDDLKREIGDDDVRRKLEQLYGHPGENRVTKHASPMGDNDIVLIRVFPFSSQAISTYGWAESSRIKCPAAKSARYSNVCSPNSLETRETATGLSFFFLHVMSKLSCLCTRVCVCFRVIVARFWYESPSTFSPAKLTQIKQATLARVLCDNGDNITLISKDVFKLPALQSPKLVPCKSIPSIDLRLWFECSGGERQQRKQQQRLLLLPRLWAGNKSHGNVFQIAPGKRRPKKRRNSGLNGRWIR